MLWAPGALDRLDFLRCFAERFGIGDRAEGTNLGLDHFLTGLTTDPRHFSLMPADVPLPRTPAIRSVPLVDPTPLYAWSLLWRGDGAHPLLPALVDGFTAEAGRNRWLEYDPSHEWLPEHPTAD